MDRKEWYLEYEIQINRPGLLGDISSLLGMLSINIISINGVDEGKRGLLLLVKNEEQIVRLESILQTMETIKITKIREPKLRDKLAVRHGRYIQRDADDTDRPDELAERLQKVLMEAKDGMHLTEEALDRTKKKKIGGFLRQLNSPEFIANQFTRYFFNGMNLFDVVPVLEDITFADLKKAANEFIEEERFTVCQVIPKK